VSRRTREIGIRVALGSSRRRIVASIFRRPLLQVGSGLLAGGVLVAALASLAAGNEITIVDTGVMAAYMVIMTVVCALACIVPTRRALGVEPTEALRAE
jgi:ABC-type antimicrobial peptide transport system permease subunit